MIRQLTRRITLAEEQHLVEQFLDLLNRDIEAGRSIGDLLAALGQSMLATFGKSLDLQAPISCAVEI